MFFLANTGSLDFPFQWPPVKNINNHHTEVNENNRKGLEKVDSTPRCGEKSMQGFVTVEKF